MARVTVFLPDDLHDRLCEEAFSAGISVAELIRSKLDESKVRRKARRTHTDPLARVEGIIRDGTLTKRIDEGLYRI